MEGFSPGQSSRQSPLPLGSVTLPQGNTNLSLCLKNLDTDLWVAFGDVQICSPLLNSQVNYSVQIYFNYALISILLHAEHNHYSLKINLESIGFI